MFAAKNFMFGKNAAAAVPVYDAVGGGMTSPVRTQSWTHTATAGATAFAFGWYAGTPTITYAGTSMTLVTSILEPVSGAIQGFWELTGVPGGAQTVTAATTTGHVMDANTVSVTGVNTVGTPSTNTGTAAPASKTITCSANQMILQSFMDNVGGMLAAPTGGTNQWDDPSNFYISINTATASTTFTASLGSSSDAWSSIGVVLS